MNSSYKIFSLFGIAVELHITFILFVLLILFLVIGGYGIYSAITAAILITALFGTVLAHELAHSIVAKSAGRKVNKITLLPIGGLASLDIPDDPEEEFMISVAGPLFNFVFAAILILIFALAYSDEFVPYMTDAVSDFIQIYVHNNAAVETDILNVSTPLSLLGTLIWINLVLGIFNLFLPAFPLDGGRVLRSLLAMQMDYVKATQVSITIGQAIFALMLLIGIIRGWIFFVFIALFMLLAAPQELKIVKMRHHLAGYKAKDIAVRNLLPVNESIRIIEFLERIASAEQYFYPVTDYEGKIAGYIDLDDMEKLDKTHINEYIIKDILRTDFGRINANAPAEDILKLISSDLIFVVDDYGSVVGFITFGHLAKVAKLKSYFKIARDGV